MKRIQIIRFILTVLLVLLFTNISASYNKASGIIGKPGDLANVSQTLKITTIEYMFLPAEIDIAKGETVKFVVENKGNKKHEMVIDTKQNLKNHAKMRRLDPDADHIGPNQIKLDPGEQKTLVWEFTRTGTIRFACPLPGHFKGMRGIINVETK